MNEQIIMLLRFNLIPQCLFAFDQEIVHYLDSREFRIVSSSQIFDDLV